MQSADNGHPFIAWSDGIASWWQQSWADETTTSDRIAS
jgi:hypothetical protein